MSTTSAQMELKEELIREKYQAAVALLDGFDHTPRLARKSAAAATPGKIGRAWHTPALSLDHARSGDPEHGAPGRCASG